jgi:adenylylsulfate kinase
MDPEAIPMDSHARSLAKAVSYRLLGSITTALIFYVLSGKVTLSIGAGALDMVAKIGLYFIHERFWARIEFGRSKPPEYEI